MLPTMDGKEHSTSNPVVLVQTTNETKKMSSTKKYVIMGVISIILLGLLLTGILVGMHIFTQAQQELVQYTLQLSGGRSQDVKSDVTGNLVSKHIIDSDHEAWIVSDFNKDIKATKILKQGLSNCYLAPLNRSNALLPSDISAPDQNNNKDSTEDVSLINKDPTKYVSIIYKTSGDPITDISFLSKEAQEMCKGVSTYWMYPSCDKESSTRNNTKSVRKREAPYYEYYTEYYNGVNYPCINGCCKTVCACQIYYTWEIVNTTIYCNWISYECCAGTAYCYYRTYCRATGGLDCTSGTC